MPEIIRPQQAVDAEAALERARQLERRRIAVAILSNTYLDSGNHSSIVGVVLELADELIAKTGG